MSENNVVNNVPPVASGFTLVPANFADAISIANHLAKSSMIPKDFQNKPENIVVAIAWGQEIGLAPLQALQSVAVINGRPAIWGDAVPAIIMGHRNFDDMIEYIEGEGDSMVATCIIKRKGKSDVTQTFSVGDAKAAGLWKKAGPWTQYPKRMLQMRARGFASRDQFPDALRGFKTAEEILDYPDDEKDITPNARPDVVMPKQTEKKPAARKNTKVEEVAETKSEAVNMDTGEVFEVNQENNNTQIINNDAIAAGQHFEEVKEKIAAIETKMQSEAVEGEPVLSAGMLNIVKKKLDNAGCFPADLCAYFDVPKIEAIPASKVNNALDWIKEHAKNA